MFRYIKDNENWLGFESSQGTGTFFFVTHTAGNKVENYTVLRKSLSLLSGKFPNTWVLIQAGMEMEKCPNVQEVSQSLLVNIPAVTKNHRVCDVRKSSKCSLKNSRVEIKRYIM